MVLLLSGAVSYSLLQHLSDQRQLQQQSQLNDQAQSYASAIQQELVRTATAAYAMAGWLRLQQGDLQQFEQFAAQIYPYYPHLKTLSAAPAGIIRAAYPAQTNQQMLGFDILQDPIQGPSAKRSLQSQLVYLTGPFQLRQGGVGIIGRLPVQLPDDTGSNHFWGFVSVTFELEALESIKQLAQLPARGIQYQLWLDDTTEQSLIISSTASAFSALAEAKIQIGTVSWRLLLSAPAATSYSKIAYWQQFLAVVFNLLLAALSYFLLRTLNSKQLLSQQVAARTADLQTQLARHRSFIVASNTGSWEFDPELQQLTCSPEYFFMLGYQSQDIPATTPQDLDTVWTDLLHPSDRQAASQAFADYLASPQQELYQNHFRMRHKDGHWVWILSRGRTIVTEQGKRLTVGTHIDISDRKESELKLQLLARLFEQSSEGLLITNAQQQVVMVNQAFCNISGYRPEEVVGKDPKLLSSGKHNKAFYQKMWQAIQQQGVWKGEIWNRRKDGTIYPEWLSISKIDGPEPGEIYYVGLFSDITQYKEDEAQIRFLAQYDALTSLPNRALLMDRTEQALAIAKAQQQPLALLFIDVDRFKQINDSLGHQIGDQLLIQIAKRLATLCRPADTLCRLSSDEFVLLRPDTNAEQAAQLAEQILPLMLTPYQVSGHELVLSASIGLALYPEDGCSFLDLYRHADIAMYRAKESGRNTYCFFTSEMQRYHARHLMLENALRRAIDLNELHLVYQPQFSLLEQRLIGFEALLRWQHPEQGFISPAEFIPLAERSGLVIPLGEWVLRTALAERATWQQLVPSDLTVAINLSPLQFRQPGLLNLITTQLEALSLPAAALELEITESAMVEDPAQAASLLEAFCQHGLRIAVDDFGTGYSSLSYLKRFALHKLKIDQSFVRDLLVDPDDRAIVKAIISMATSLDLQTIAEGVETAEQQALLQQLGCQAIQGYHYGKPMQATAAREMISRELGREP
ncbi:MAG: EAL domain-containing protein [Alishewanella agri]|nr:EAL domain-containing protein [Alishewanella agri]